MNKTAIIEFIIDEILLKLWCVSQKMRTKLKWMLKNRVLILKEYSAKALLVADWVELSKEMDYTLANMPLNKGMSNYTVTNEKDFQTLLALNSNKVCCSMCLSAKMPQRSLDKMREVNIDNQTYSFYEDLSFSSIDTLTLIRLKSQQIQNVIKRVKNIRKLRIFDSELAEIDFSSNKISDIFIQSSTVEGKCVFPSKIDNLQLVHCSNFISLKFNKVNKLDLCDDYSYEEKINKMTWIESLKTLKEASFSMLPEYFLDYRHETIRKLKFSGSTEMVFASDLRFNLPNLLFWESKLSIGELEDMNLRAVCLDSTDFEGRTSIRPRKIEINYDNSPILAKHPEIFEKVEHIELVDGNFDLDVLNTNIKEIVIYSVNLKSKLIKRL